MRDVELGDAGCRIKKVGYFVLGTSIEAIGRGIQVTGAYCALFAPTVGVMLQNGFHAVNDVSGKEVPIELRYAVSKINGDFTAPVIGTGKLSFADQFGSYNTSYTLPNPDISNVYDIAKIATPVVAGLGVAGVLVGSEIAKLGSYIRGNDTSFKEALLDGARDVLAASSVALASTATNLAIVNEGLKKVPEVPEKVGHKVSHKFDVHVTKEISVLGMKAPLSFNIHADVSGSGYAHLNQFSELKENFHTPESMIFLMYGGSAACGLAAMGLNSISNNFGEKRILSRQKNECKTLENDVVGVDDNSDQDIEKGKKTKRDYQLNSVLVDNCLEVRGPHSKNLLSTSLNSRGL